MSQINERVRLSRVACSAKCRLAIKVALNLILLKDFAGRVGHDIIVVVVLLEAEFGRVRRSQLKALLYLVLGLVYFNRRRSVSDC